MRVCLQGRTAQEIGCELSGKLGCDANIAILIVLRQINLPPASWGCFDMQLPSAKRHCDILETIRASQTGLYVCVSEYLYPEKCCLQPMATRRKAVGTEMMRNANSIMLLLCSLSDEDRVS